MAAGVEGITAIRLPQGDRPAEVVFRLPVDGNVQRLLVADQKLFAVTLEGQIMALGGHQTGPTSSLPVGSVLAEFEPIPLDGTPEVATQSKTCWPQVVPQAVPKDMRFGLAIPIGEWPCGVLAKHSPFIQLAMVDSDESRVRAVA